MNTVAKFDSFASRCSQTITKEYSTSFYSAIQLLDAEIRKPIYAIYGMVRLADEIVDTFHDYDKDTLLSDFKEDTFKAIRDKISLNPILETFQIVVNKYNIEHELINSFFESMRSDLVKTNYLNEPELNKYVYGSAEVVGLMCLQVFCNGNRKTYDSLKKYAQALGSAFQKVNFLRDLQSDVDDLNRFYFPGFKGATFNDSLKQKIEKDIQEDFRMGFEGIKRLPLNCRFGVYVAYRYYMALFKKLKRTTSETILEKRVRIPNHIKMVIVFKAGLRSQLNLI